MGIFNSLNTAVSGLKAQSSGMSNISGNIANSQTIGFKRVDTSFVDLVIDRPRDQVQAGSVRAIGQQAISVQGEVRPTDETTNMAINGEGFFSVSEIQGQADGDLIFSDNNLFTRRGDFQLDKDGYLVNGAGMYLRGDSINRDGLVTSINGVVRIDQDDVPATATSQIDYSVTLPQTAGTNLYDENDEATQLLTHDAPGAWGGNVPATVTSEHTNAFLSRTISGGSLTVYNDAGSPIDLQLRWGKTDNDDNTWALYYQSDGKPQDDADITWRQLGEAQFNDDGSLDNDNTDFAFPADANDRTVNGIQLPDNIDFVMGQQNSKQQFVANGLIRNLDLGQNGFPPGSLQDIDISADGRISGIYSNGEIFPLARLSIAQFEAPNMLKSKDGGTFEATIDSGPPLIAPDGTSIVSGAVEASNVDIATEFSKLIVTQQAYSANTRVITTSQQLMETTINMVR